MKIGIADTMFAKTDMFGFAKKAIEDSKESVEIERYTVPGVKDLAVACKILFEKYECDVCIALGMPGPEKVDKTCSHEASLMIGQVQLLTNKHILEVFVHMDEAKDDADLNNLSHNRVYDHTINAIALVKGKEQLSTRAGQGVRQGRESVGAVKK